MSTVREDIERYAKEEDKEILLWLFSKWHWASEWRQVSVSHPAEGRYGPWRYSPSELGRLAYLGHLSQQNLSITGPTHNPLRCVESNQSAGSYKETNMKITKETIALAYKLSTVAQSHGVDVETVASILDEFSDDTAEAAPVTTAAAEATPTYRDLNSDEVIKSGDEWILKPQFKHRAGKTRMYRPASSDAIGTLAGSHSKSTYRRKIVG